jgi:hypothetical protein
VKRRLYFGLSLLFIVFDSYTQDCNVLVQSQYFSYPENSNDSTVTYRSKDRLVEKDLRTGDSTVWKIKWTSKCSYTAEYVLGNRKLSPGDREYLEKHKFAFEVESMNKDYFIASAYIDKVSGKPFSRDTAFFQRKPYALNKLLFQPVKNLAELRKQKFSDTSQYAVVCIYRKGKFPCLIIDGQIFFGGSLMAILPNKSAAIFKVKKEGKFEIESYGKDKSLKKEIDIQFGKKYYINFDPVLLKGCRFEIFIEDEKLAKEEFESLL